MQRLLNASLKAIGSVFAPGMLGVFVGSILLALAVLTAFIFVVTMFATLVTGGASQDYQHYIPWLTGIGAFILAYLLFPGIMPLVVSFFDNKIATLIEKNDYPAAQPCAPAFWPEFWHDVRFALLAIGLNILVLPLYFVPVVNVFVFYVLNGHLLGREFFVMVAKRYRSIGEARALRATHSRTIFAAGVLLSMLATIPLLNLFAPFWGIAVMTHLYHTLAGTKKVEVLLPAA